MLFPRSVLVAGGAGVLSHVLYFVHGEHHLHAAWIFRLFLLFPVAYSLLIIILGQSWSLGVLSTACGLEIVYGTSLLLSIATYRICLHRTRQFPGPFLAGLTKWHHFFNTLNCDQHIFLEGLHHRYGDFVRTG